MARKRIDKKIMAFVGTNDASKVIDHLAQYTDDIYAATASEYGNAVPPGGNITILRKYIDEEGIRRWIERGINMVVDGTDITAEEPRKLIKRVCEEMNVEYLRVAANFETNLNTVFTKSIDDIIRTVEYAVDKILVQGNLKMYKALTAAKEYQSKVIVLIPNNPEMLQAVKDIGYPSVNIICADWIMKPDFLMALFKERDITHYIMLGEEKIGLTEKLTSITRTMVKATVFGEIPKEEGMTGEKMWEQLSERFDLEDEYF